MEERKAMWHNVEPRADGVVLIHKDEAEQPEARRKSSEVLKLCTYNVPACVALAVKLN